MLISLIYTFLKFSLKVFTAHICLSIPLCISLAFSIAFGEKGKILLVLSFQSKLVSSMVRDCAVLSSCLSFFLVAPSSFSSLALLFICSFNFLLLKIISISAITQAQSINFLDPLILGGSLGQQLELDPPSISILCNNG